MMAVERVRHNAVDVIVLQSAVIQAQLTSLFTLLWFSSLGSLRRPLLHPGQPAQELRNLLLECLDPTPTIVDGLVQSRTITAAVSCGHQHIRTPKRTSSELSGREIGNSFNNDGCDEGG